MNEEILSLLRENARLSFTRIGRAVGLSANAVAERVRRMEADQIITGYTVVADPEAPGRPGLHVFIDVRLDTGVEATTFATSLRALPQVHEAVHLTGPYDYLLRARVGDPGQLDRLLRRLKQDCGAAQTQTRVALGPSIVSAARTGREDP